jgi:hypothetical protein
MQIIQTKSIIKVMKNLAMTKIIQIYNKINHNKIHNNKTV